MRSSILKTLPEFISQDEFNDFVQYGSVHDVAMVSNKYVESLVGFDSRGMSPLMRAAYRTDKDWRATQAVVDLLIDSGAKMNAGSYMQTTPLCCAATRPRHILQIFAERETNWTQYEHFAVKPWRIALCTSVENFSVILPYIPTSEFRRRTDTGHTLLTELITTRPSGIDIALSDPRMRNIVNCPDKTGQTPMAYAARMCTNRRQVIKALMECGANLLYVSNGYKIFYRSDMNRTPGIDYMRLRIRYRNRNEEFDMTYDEWYK